MKRFITLFFALIMVFMFTACDPAEEEISKAGEDIKSKAESVADDISKEVSDKTEEYSESVSDDISDNVSEDMSGDLSEDVSEDVSEDISDEVSEEESVSSSEAEDDLSDVTVEEIVVYNENDIKVTVHGIKQDTLLGTVGLELLVENNTEESVSLGTELCAINGIMATPVLAVDVSAGKKANTEMAFFAEELEVLGITAIKDFKFILEIYDTENWEDIFISNLITVNTVENKDFQQSVNDEGETIYEENGIKIVAQDIKTDDFFETSDLYLYIENNTENTVDISASDTAVNGFMLEPIFYCSIMPATKAITAMSFFDSELAENDIEEISEIEFTISITDHSTWDNIAESDVITIKFE